MFFKILPNILKSKPGTDKVPHKSSKAGKCESKYEHKAKNIKSGKKDTIAFDDEWDNWFPWEV